MESDGGSGTECNNLLCIINNLGTIFYIPLNVIRSGWLLFPVMFPHTSACTLKLQVIPSLNDILSFALLVNLIVKFVCIVVS